LLARREHARTELGRKLSQRGFSESLVGEVLDALEAENLLSDRRFTESFVEQRMARGQGPLKIRHELRERGISAELAKLVRTGTCRAAQTIWRRVSRRHSGTIPPGALSRPTWI
jgi:SOS response regulatory protein OraA/RecX